MKRVILLLTIISHFSFGQNNSPQYNSTTKTTTQYTGVVPKAPVWSATDSMNTKSPIYKFETGRVKFKNLATSTDTATYNKVLVLSGDSLRQMSRSYFGGGGGSATIDTTKVGRIEQGRGTAPIFMYFNGVAWVRNDTSYVAQTGTNKFSGNFLSNQSFLQVGLNSTNNTLTFIDEVFTGIKSASATSETQISAYSTANGYADISVYNPLGGLYDRRIVITGTGNNTPDQSFRIQNGLLYYFGNYTTYMTDDRTVPDIGKVKQLISDSVGTVQSTTLADGKIWIGDGTNTAFPRTLSGDVTVSNLGVTSYNGVVPATKGGTGQSSYTIGDILTATTTTTLSKTTGNKTINRRILTQYGDSANVTNTSWNPLKNTDMYQSEQVSLGWGAGALFYGFGDSFTEGGACSIPTAQTYFATIVEKLGTVSTNANRGVGSIGVFNCFKAVGQVETVLPNKFSATMMIGYNDIRNNLTVAGVNRIENGHRAIIAQHLLNAAIPANSGSVSTTGTWGTLTPTTFNDLASLKLSGLARTSSVAGSTLTYTSTGSNLVIGCWGSNTTTYDDGRFAVTIDGVLKTTWNPANNAVLVTTPTSQDPGRNHNALVYFDLGGGTHTVIITTLDNKPTLIDYFGTLQNASEAPTMLVMGILKGTDYSYQGGTYGSNEIYENANQRIIKAVNEFRLQGYGIRYVEGNDNGWDRKRMICADSIHPNQSGYAKIAENFLGAVNRNFLPSQHSTLSVKAKTTTNSSGYFASNSNATSRAIGMLTYPQTFTRSGFVTANSSALQSTSDTLNIGSYSTSNASIGFFAGGFAETDIKARLSSTGIFTVQNATANTTQIFARNATAAQGSQIFTINDANKYISTSVYGSSNTAAFSQANACVLFSNDNFYVGSNSATGKINFFTGGGLASVDIKATILPSGNVGIGITTPTALLHVSTNGQSLSSVFTPSSVVLPITYSSSKILLSRIIVSNDTNGRRGLNYIYKTRGSNTSPATVASADLLGDYRIGGFDGTSLIDGIGMSAVVDNTVSTGVMPTAILFSTTTTNTLLERMRITSAGNVGIGTSSPTAKLHVEGTVVIKSYTVATLPACAAGIYTRATVTDALAPVYDATVAGGGARVIEVLCNGTNWVCH